MKTVVAMTVGILIGCGIGAIAQDFKPVPQMGQLHVENMPQEAFVYAGGKDDQGNGRILRMTPDGLVMAKCEK
jgi:hypothetical protein